MTAGSARDERSRQLLKTFNDAVALHVAGRLAEAAVLYEGLLRQLPTHPDVLDFYGTLRHQLGDHGPARALVERSVTARPLSAATRNRLGSIQKALGDGRKAGLSFRRAAVLDPRLAEPVVNLAGLHRDGGEAGPALNLYARALAADPRSADALLGRAMARNRLERFEGARADLDRLRPMQPLNPEVRLQSAIALAGSGDWGSAIREVRAGIVTAPQAFELYAALTGCRSPIEDGEPSHVAWARRGVVLRPLEGRLWSNLGIDLYRNAEPRAALNAARRAVVLLPGEEAAMQTLTAAAHQSEEAGMAAAACRRVLLAYPGNADVAFRLAELEFVSGDLGHAWDLYEHRIGRRVFRPRLSLPPAWRGPGTETGPILVASEQGVGDELIFLSCLPDMLRQVRVPVVVEVDRRIVAAVARTFPEVTVIPRQLVPGDGLGQFFDYAEASASHGLHHSVFAGSLPRFFRRDRQRPPSQGGYLRPDPDRVAHWRTELARFRPERTVGVVWRSALMTKYRARHHAGILDWAPVFRVPGCAFVNLMHGDVQPELDLLREREGVEVHQLAGIDLWDDIDGLLALLAALDVVVAARTANCAFAAAVGTPTIRVAQSFNRISDGRDFFFANVWPTLPRDRPFAAGPAAEEAGRLLREKIAAS